MAKETGFTPPALLRKPKLRPDCIGYFEAFHALSCTRRWSKDGLQPITISEMTSYCDVFGIPRGEARATFVRLLIRMDSAYLARIHKAK